MPLISKVLRMNGKAITTPEEFCEYFSPADLLRNKELAAYFAITYMEQLSPLHTYYSQGLHLAVTTGYQKIYAENYIEGSGYWGCNKEAGIPGWSGKQTRELMAFLEQDPFKRSVCMQVDSIVMKTSLPPEKQAQLSQILAFAYLLAGKLPEDRPISPAEAEAAFLGKAWVPKATFRDTPEGRIYQARKEPYKLTLRKSSVLALGETITLRKLMAEPSPQGSAALPVTLQLPDRQETILPGDYRYASFVGEEMVRLYPLEKRNGNRVLVRQGNTLLLKDASGKLLETIPLEKANIVDMVPGPWKNEWILLTPNWVDYRKFSEKDLPDLGIVEVQMVDDIVYLLTNRGEILRHGYPISKPRAATMDGHPAITQGG